MDEAHTVSAEAGLEDLRAFLGGGHLREGTHYLLAFVLVAAISLLMALLAGLWPSWEASNLKPMEIIRYT